MLPHALTPSSSSSLSPVHVHPQVFVGITWRSPSPFFFFEFFVFLSFHLQHFFNRFLNAQRFSAADHQQNLGARELGAQGGGVAFLRLRCC